VEEVVEETEDEVEGVVVGLVEVDVGVVFQEVEGGEVLALEGEAEEEEEGEAVSVVEDAGRTNYTYSILNRRVPV
jgi:hypothetical protein